jgi:hypothetical protein
MKIPEKLQGTIRKVGVSVDMWEWMARSGGFRRRGGQSLPLMLHGGCMSSSLRSMIGKILRYEADT